MTRDRTMDADDLDPDVGPDVDAELINPVDLVYQHRADHDGRQRAPLPFKLPHHIIDDDLERHYLVDGLLGIAELSCLVAPPETGKTAMAVDLACHVAAGLQWGGRETAYGGVVYVALEREGQVTRRVAAFRKHHAIASFPVAIVTQQLDLRDPESAQRIIDTADALEDSSGQMVQLVIVDTLNRAMPGADENSSVGMGAVGKSLETIRRETSAHVMIVHHPPNDSPHRLRGHGSMFGNIDTGLFLDRSDDVLTVQVGKSNEGDGGESVSFKMISVPVYENRETGRLTTASVLVPLQKAQGKTDTPKDARKEAAALEALDRLCEDEETVLRSPGSQARAVATKAWREELFRLKILDPDSSNPRVYYKRLKDSLIKQDLIVEDGDLVWRKA